jgi:hypothetical protein
MATHTRCTATTQKGAQCKRKAVQPGCYCHQHGCMAHATNHAAPPVAPVAAPAPVPTPAPVVVPAAPAPQASRHLHHVGATVYNTTARGRTNSATVLGYNHVGAVLLLVQTGPCKGQQWACNPAAWHTTQAVAQAAPPHTPAYRVPAAQRSPLVAWLARQ